MDILLLDCGSSKVPLIQEQIVACGQSCTTLLLPQGTADAVNAYDALIISGGPHLFTDPLQVEGLQKAFVFIDEVQIPILGICLGHQALGIRAGANVYRGEERRSKETLRLEDHPLFKGYKTGCSFTCDHCEGIGAPDSYRVIASSEYYPVEAIADDTASRYGVQFHPESDGSHGQLLFENFFRLVSDLDAS